MLSFRPKRSPGILPNAQTGLAKTPDGWTGGWVPGSRNRVNRGGGFDNEAANAQSGKRNANSPENRNDNNGLRVANASPRQIARVIHPRAVHVTPRPVSRAGFPAEEF